MKYKINIVPNGVSVDRITPREARRTSLFMALTALGIATIAIGYLFSVDFETESDVPLVAAGFGSLLGLGFLVHVMFAGRLLRPLPEQVLFNNERGVVEFMHNASVSKKIEIPYSHVLTVDSRNVSHWDPNSKKFNTRYAVTLYLTDGSSWDLMEPSIMESSYATDFAEKIKNNTSLEKATSEQIILPKFDSPRLSVTHRGDETQVRWRNGNPANMGRRLAIPAVIIIVSWFMSLMSEGDEWAVLFDELRTNVNGFGDLVKVPGLMGGLVISTMIVFICLVVLLVQVVLIVRYRRKENKITVNKSFIISKGSEVSIPVRSAGTACLTYCIGRGPTSLEIRRHLTQFKTTESTAFEGDLNLKTVFGMMGKSIKEDVKKAVDETFNGSKEPSNVLAEFSFDKFSPLDVYVVKESIREKLSVA